MTGTETDGGTVTHAHSDVRRVGSESRNRVRGSLGARIPEVLVVVLGCVLWSTGSFVGRLAPVDNVSYLSIAENWAAGRWSEAVNGYWSPLFSWLLIPFSWTGMDGNDAAFVIGVAAAVAATDRLRVLCRAVTTVGPRRHAVTEIMLVGSVPFQLFTIFRLAVSDALMAVGVFAALAALFDLTSTSVRRGIRVGMWSSFAFLAKAVALPLMVSVIAGWAAITLIDSAAGRVRRDRRASPTTVGIGYGVLGVSVLATVAVLSVHYGEFTLNRSATYHAQITAPGARGNPFEWAGLLEPTNDQVISAWEDPSLATSPDGIRIDLSEPAPGAPSGDPRGDGDGRLSRFVDNLARAARPTTALAGSVIVAALSALASIALAVRRWVRRDEIGPRLRAVLSIVLCAGFYVAGLSLLVVGARYLLTAILLAVPLAAWGLDHLATRRSLGGGTILVIAVLVAVASSVRPAVSLAGFPDVVSSYDDPLVPAVVAIREGDRVASLEMDLGFLAVCRQAGCTYWGEPTDSSDVGLAAELSSADIDVLAVPSDQEGRLPSGVTGEATILANWDEYTLLDASTIDAGP